MQWSKYIPRRECKAVQSMDGSHIHHASRMSPTQRHFSTQSSTLIKNISTTKFEGASATKIEEYALIKKKAADKFNADQELVNNKAERSKVGPSMLCHAILIGLPDNGV